MYLTHDWLRAPYITNDGYQYLDAALSARSEGCLCIHEAHFDEQVAPGHLPIELTHYPPGYPLLIAGLSKVGFTLPVSGYLLSASGYMLTVWLLWDVAMLLGSHPALSVVAALIWITNKIALFHASSVLTDTLFTAALMAIVALVIRDLKNEGRRPPLLIAIGALAGISYLIRYAGLFLIPPIVLYLAWRALRTRRSLPGALAGFLATCICIVPVLMRNVLVMGSWQGVFLSKAPYNVAALLPQGLFAVYHLVLGDLTLVPFPIWRAFVVISLTGAASFGLSIWRTRQTGNNESLLGAFAWIVILTLVYLAGTLFAKARMANMNAESPDIVRYMLPVFPAVLACLAAVVSTIRIKTVRVAACAVALAIMIIQGLNFVFRPGPSEHLAIAAAMDRETADGESVTHWLHERVPSGAVIVSEEGQALHYLTQRPVVSIIEPPENSNRRTDEAGLRALMSRYGSRYLMLFPALRAPSGSLPFIRELLAGGAPKWLVRHPGSGGIVIYECERCAR